MVREATVLELASALTSLVLAGKVDSHIAGSLGTMRLTKQIEALEVMSLHTHSYLVLPRIVAARHTFPLLLVLAMALRPLDGYLAGTATGLITAPNYLAGLCFAFVPYTVWFALVKAVVFGVLVAAIAACCGYHARGRAWAVGTSSAAAVSHADRAILVAGFGLARRQVAGRFGRVGGAIGRVRAGKP